MIVGGGLVFLYGPGAIRWVELQIKKAHLESEVDALKSENARLYQEARKLREDPSYAEAIARRELGFVRPGETVIRVKEQKQETRKQRLQ